MAHMTLTSKIYVAGHRGLVGSAVMRALQEQGFTNIVTRTADELDLRDQQAVNQFFATERPEFVLLAAAKVGGILANKTYPAQFIYDNLMIEANVIHAAHTYGVKKLLFLGSSCIYPRECPQPIREEYLLTGPLEPTNEAYALAKISGLMLCKSYRTEYGDNFISCMPTNLYGPHDNYHPTNSHVIPGLIARMIQAHEHHDPTFTLWGTGRALREFLYVDDLAQALIFLMQNYEGDEHINIGTGVDCTIAEVAQKIKEIIGYQGEFVYDTTKPDGTPRKILDVSKIKALGWQAQTPLYEGLKKAIAWYQQHRNNARYDVPIAQLSIVRHCKDHHATAP